MSSLSQTLVKIVDDEVQLEKLVNRDQLLRVLNTDPPEAWVKDHPFASNVKYLPIDKIELLLSRIFQDWHVEVKSVQQLLNSMTVVVRLHYRDPIDNEYRWQDGVGAVPAKTDKDARASDMTAIKSDAVMTGLPAAESFAIKDAAEKIGRLFGKDLNRKDTIGFSAVYNTIEAKDKLQEAKDKLKDDLDESS